MQCPALPLMQIARVVGTVVSTPAPEVRRRELLLVQPLNL
jgi:microcompartment protein CcmK/EutM